MRISAAGPALLLLCLTSGGVAAREVHEPHVMLYYRVPFAAGSNEARPGLGFRLDQTMRESGEILDYAGLAGSPALLGFEMGPGGVHSFTVAGFRHAGVLHADGEGGAEPGAGEGAEEGRSLGDILEATPKGWLIGIAIGVVIVSGVAD